MQQFEHLDEHNLDSLRGLVRVLQEENRNPRALLAERNINTDKELQVYAPQIDDNDPDQGRRILPVTINEDIANFFFSMFWGRKDVYALRGKKADIFQSAKTDGNRCARRGGERKFSVMMIVYTENGCRLKKNHHESSSRTSSGWR